MSHVNSVSDLLEWFKTISHHEWMFVSNSLKESTHKSHLFTSLYVCFCVQPAKTMLQSHNSCKIYFLLQRCCRFCSGFLELNSNCWSAIMTFYFCYLFVSFILTQFFISDRNEVTVWFQTQSCLYPYPGFPKQCTVKNCWIDSVDHTAI